MITKDARRLGNWRDNKDESYAVDEITSRDGRLYWESFQVNDESHSHQQVLKSFGACKKYTCNCPGFFWRNTCKHINNLRILKGCR